jgi:hypothetical protein
MKFELDHKTGMMRPKKDEEIYFAQSQGGGLIVDDKKNNIKYIIERDGRITKLFGSFDKDNLNLYDMRDARIIADRVVRLLGRDHKYSDFHYFLRGYHMNESVIESCSDFLNESVWTDIQSRSAGDTVRKEDEITNIKSLKPLDMGGSVLWADDDLSLKDGDCYFTFDEVFELVKNSGWRLPTLEEVAELDDIYKKGSFWENDDRFVFDGFPHQLVFFKKGLIYTSASDEPIDEDYYYCWTSSLFPNNNRFVNIFTFNDGKPCHTPLNDQHNVNDSVTQDTTNGKLCVRLVKDK